MGKKSNHHRQTGTRNMSSKSTVAREYMFQPVRMSPDRAEYSTAAISIPEKDIPIVESIVANTVIADDDPEYILAYSMTLRLPVSGDMLNAARTQMLARIHRCKTKQDAPALIAHGIAISRKVQQSLSLQLQA